ncbi:hypothetical protein QYM36_012767 [Artemia franciscana]|uniref:Uncharacterized protein n=1 Tax=Artemia franciscana TaxID=6661 RepID=A0AA88HLR4_ARTSF|nr:hypothetical protein QYM36_012767 [Artemia franciscana]KAK2711756.1 hypothetical protein QYM36_012767 [Artemia franciscana]
MAASIDPGTPSSRGTSATPRKMGAQQYYPGFSPPRDSPGRHVRSLKFGSREGRASERHPTRRGIDGRTNGKLSDSDEERPPVMVRSRTGTGFNIASPVTEKESSPRLNFRREYGSHGSIDMLTTGSERDNFYAFLREFGSNSSQDERSRESSHDSRSRDKLTRNSQPFSIANPVTVRSENVSDDVSCPPSPKPKSKFKFFDGKGSKKVKVKDVTSVTSRSTSEPSIFKKLRPGSKVGAGCIPLSSVNSVETKGFSVLSGYDSDVESRLEDKLRRKAFGHHDCQSLAANLSYVAQLRSILSQRRNTTTGASAASQSNKGLTSPQNKNGSENNNEISPILEHKDPGDGKSNPIVLSCPYFRNEFGGEAEWCIPLTRANLERLSKSKRRSIASSPSKSISVPSEVLLRPACTYGLSVLEFPPDNTHWIHGICPYQRQPITVENIDAGALYYRSYFYGQEHQNWFGMDENLGPVAISIKREKMAEELTSRNADCNGHQNQSSRHLYRLIIRTSEVSF